MNLKQSRRMRSCLIGCVITLLTTTVFTSAFINKAAAADSTIQVEPPYFKDSSVNLVLDANNGEGNLYLYPKSDRTNSNHLWTKTSRRSDGYFMLTSKRNGYALDANGGTGNLYLNPNPDRKNPNHYWRFTQVRGFYMITSSVNGYALDANGGTGNLYLNPNPDKGNPNHLWKIIDIIGSYKAIGSSLKNQCDTVAPLIRRTELYYDIDWFGEASISNSKLQIPASDLHPKPKRR